MENGQLEIIAERTIKVTPPVEERDPQTGEELPRVAFPSVLMLTRDQENLLVEHCLRRVDELEDESGRKDVLGDNWWANQGDGTDASVAVASAANTWMGRRARWEAMYRNDVSWRPILYPDSIFAESNEVVPLSRRICRQMQARADNYFFATDPWFSADVEQSADNELGNKLDRYCQWKLKKTESKKHKQRAVRKAFILGETVVKTTYQVREQIYQTTVRALVGADGEPIRDSRGEFVLENALWAELPESPGVEVLASDPSVVKPEAPVYIDQVITKRHVMFEGPESKPIFFKDFLAPLTAPDLQTADICIHLYDRPVMDMVDLFAKRGALTATDSERYAAMQRAVAALREMMNNTAEAKSGQMKGEALERNGEVRIQNAPAGQNMPIVELAECYVWYDANGDGVLENLLVLIDRKSRLPIYYNYVANETPDGERPLDVVTVQEVDDRWYGVGVMEMFESTQTIMDLLVNRWNMSQSRAGRVDFWDPSKTLEGDRDPNLLLNWGRSYTAKPGVDPDTILKSVYLNDVKFEALQNMFQFFQQMAMNESGVMNSNDAASAGLDTGKLATGIRNIEKAGEELFAPFLSNLEPGLTAVLNRELDVLLANFNAEESYTYFQGDTQLSETLKPEEVAGVKLRVSLYLTRYKGEQLFQQSSQIVQVVQAFYQQPPEVQERTAEFFRQMVRALDPKVDANQVINPLPPLPIGPDGQPIAPAAASGGGRGQPSAAKPVQIHANTNPVSSRPKN